MSTLYHYCSSSTFVSIVSEKKIWLSSLSLSNDSMEGKLVSQTFERIMEQEETDPNVASEIRNAIQRIEALFDGLGFCLSEEDDLLSQWRGYAEDGQGFSIGFSKAYLQALSESKESDEAGFHLHQVLYTPSEHENALIPIHEEIKAWINAGNLKKPGFLVRAIDEGAYNKKVEKYNNSINELRLKLLEIHPRLYTLKNKAFSEEREWRLLSYVIRSLDDHTLFRASGNRLIPYRSFRLKDIHPSRIISEVVIGPKNITPEFFIENFLKQNGFHGVSIRRSTATYR